MSRKPFMWIELDVDYAGSTLTIRICEPVSGIPAGELFFPCLTSVSLRSGSVNIGGADERLSAFGERAELSFTVSDFPYHDRLYAAYEGTTVVSGGTHWSRLLARWPAFSGANCRQVWGNLDNSVITIERTKHFILRNVRRSHRETYTWTAIDPLDLAANGNALAPAPSSGVLFDDVSDTDTSFTLSPVGIGDEEYPAEGRASIGSEYFTFTRSGDVITFGERGFKNTDVGTHSAGDTVQVALFYERARMDEVGSDLLLNYATMDPAQIPTATWAAERSRWAPTRRITTDILEPTPVDELIAEVALLGCSFWWRDVQQEVGFKTIRPPDGDTVWQLSDDDVKQVDVDYMDEDRITEILFSTVQKSANESKDNFDGYQRHRLVVDSDAVALYKGRRQLQVNSRLLNQGADSAVGIIAKRLLKLRASAPIKYTLLLDAKDREIDLTDIIELTTEGMQDTDGNPVPQSMQVTKVEEQRGGDIRVTCQAYTYGGRLAYFAPTGAPTYAAATAEQREQYAFFADPVTKQMPDGSDAYEFI